MMNSVIYVLFSWVLCTKLALLYILRVYTDIFLLVGGMRQILQLANLQIDLVDNLPVLV